MGEGDKKGPARRGATPPAIRPARAPWTPSSDVRRPELGPRPISSLVPRLTRPAFKRRSPAGAMLMSDWAEVVGPAIAAVTVPRRLTAGTLTIACSGPVAMELQHLAPQLMARINAATGAITVEALRFVGAASGAAPAVKPRQALPVPETVRDRIEAVGDTGLRDALARLARGVYRSR